MRGMSFVICTTGARDALLDEVVLPAIFDQCLDSYEVIVVGGYRGRHQDRVTAISEPVGGDLFYKPFQAGVEKARHEWIVDLDDDMLIAADWAQRLRDAAISPGGIYGFRMLNPDGTHFGTYFDAVDNRLSGRRRRTSYFASYIAPRELLRRVPYPTYQSGDRAHVFRLHAVKPATPRRALAAVEVVHLGAAGTHPGLVPKTAIGQIVRMRPLRRFLAEQGIAWIPFADRYLDGRPDVTLDEAWRAARAATTDPAMRQRHHWLL